MILEIIFIKRVLTIPKECGKYECSIEIVKHPNASIELKQEVADLLAKDLLAKGIDKKSKHWNTVNEIHIDIKTCQLFKELKNRTLTEYELRKIAKEVLTTEINCEKNKRNAYNILVGVAEHPNSTISLAEKIREHISNDKTIHEDIKMRSLSRIDSVILKKKEMGDNLQQLKQFGQNIQNAFEAFSASRTMGK